ncbi:hypothetical protein [Bosea sp. Leaf344]|uniref:hypothetical protein n=1 Tax=Bosea sp. Leaf344 TaxID=1736346 RepID=UPI000A450FB9|nr:hypothetical protein [Bosea sp. Leaf344]
MCSISKRVCPANKALVGASAETAWSNGLSLAASFDGEFARKTSGYAGKATLSYRW